MLIITKELFDFIFIFLLLCETLKNPSQTELVCLLAHLLEEYIFRGNINLLSKDTSNISLQLWIECL